MQLLFTRTRLALRFTFCVSKCWRGPSSFCSMTTVVHAQLKLADFKTLHNSNKPSKTFYFHNAKLRHSEESNLENKFESGRDHCISNSEVLADMWIVWSRSPRWLIFQLNWQWNVNAFQVSLEKSPGDLKVFVRNQTSTLRHVKTLRPIKSNYSRRSWPERDNGKFSFLERLHVISGKSIAFRN